MIKLLKSSFIYVLFSFIQKGFTFLITPYLTYKFSPKELGEFSEVQLLWGLFVVFGIFGFDETIAKLYIDKYENRDNWINRIISYQLTILFIIFILIGLFHDYLPPYINNLNGIICLYSWVFGTTIYYTYLKIIRISEDKKYFIQISSVYTLFQTSIILVLTNLETTNNIFLLYAYSITSLLFGLYSLFKLNFKLNFSKRRIILYSFNFSKNIFWNNLNDWLKRSFPLLVLSSGSFGTAQLGLFASISIFSIGFTELAKAVTNALQPFILKELKNNQIIKSFKINFVSYLIGLLTLLVLYIISYDIYKLLINDNFDNLVSKNLITLNLILGYFYFINIIQNQTIFYYKKMGDKIFVFQTITSIIILGVIAYLDNIDIEQTMIILISSFFALAIYKEFLIKRNHSHINIYLFDFLPFIIIFLFSFFNAN